MPSPGVDPGHDDRGEIERRRDQKITLVPYLRAHAWVEALGDEPGVVPKEPGRQGHDGQVDAEIYPPLPVIEPPRRDEEKSGHYGDPQDATDPDLGFQLQVNVIINQKRDIFNISLRRGQRGILCMPRATPLPGLSDRPDGFQIRPLSSDKNDKDQE